MHTIPCHERDMFQDNPQTYLWDMLVPSALVGSYSASPNKISPCV